MWIYDGEEWTNEGASDNATRPDPRPHPDEMFYPELQVVEVVIPVPRTNYVPTPLPTV